MMLIWAALGSVCSFIPAISEVILTGGYTMRHIGFLAYALAAVMLLLAIVFMVRGSKCTGKIRQLIASYGVLSEEDLYAHIRSSEQRRKDQKAYETKRSDADQEITRLKQRLNSEKQVADGLLRRMGRTFASVEDLNTAASDARKIIRAVGDAVGEAEKAKAAADAVRTTLNGQSEEMLEAILARTEWAGDIPEEELPKLRSDYETKCGENDRLQSAIHERDLELARLNATAENPAAIADSISEKEALLSKLNLKHDALRLACDSIERAADNLRRNVAPKLSGQASTLMRKTTNGKYETLGVSDKLDMEYGAQNQDSIGYTTRDIDFMSAGTRDLAYISLRLALVGLLYRKSQPPMFFDESFARLDDSRLACMFGLLREYAAGGSQIFLFTSQHRDALILGEQGTFHHIKLS